MHGKLISKHKIFEMILIQCFLILLSSVPQAIINFQSMFHSIDLLHLLPVHIFFSPFIANSIYNNDIGCDTFSPKRENEHLYSSAVKKNY
jgi:hypothetical protein